MLLNCTLNNIFLLLLHAPIFSFIEPTHCRFRTSSFAFFETLTLTLSLPQTLATLKTLKMHTSTLLSLLIATGLALAAPQADPSTLPVCVQQAGLSAATATGCEDASCFCTNQAFITNIKAYLAANCSPSDQAGKSTINILHIPLY
jgi:hypothetical protein